MGNAFGGVPAGGGGGGGRAGGEDPADDADWAGCLARARSAAASVGDVVTVRTAWYVEARGWHQAGDAVRRDAAAKAFRALSMG